MVAHAIVGSPLWTVRADPQNPHNDAIAESLETATGETMFDERRRAVLALMGFSPEQPRLTDASRDRDLAGVFAKLMRLGDAQVMEVIGVVMGETLASGSAIIELAGAHIGLDMARFWQADAAFFDLVRDGDVLTALLADVAGKRIASANASEKGKAKKAIIRDCLDGANGRAKRENWVPKWMQFPPAAYTKRGGVTTAAAYASIARHLPGDDTDPSAPARLASRRRKPKAEEPAQVAA
jgi:ParB family chromosome partitioning protein